jgi:hypothetical protein
VYNDNKLGSAIGNIPNSSPRKRNLKVFYLNKNSSNETNTTANNNGWMLNESQK